MSSAATQKAWRDKNPDRCKQYRINNTASTKASHKRKLEWLREIKSSLSCKSCGESRAWCLDFHHRNPAEKEYKFSQLRYWSRARILEEIDKCDVLCANCHRDYHYQLNVLKEDTL